MHDHQHEPHPCPRTGKCCGRCKLAIPGKVAVGLHAADRVSDFLEIGHPEHAELLLALSKDL